MSHEVWLWRVPKGVIILLQSAWLVCLKVVFKYILDEKVTIRKLAHFPHIYVTLLVVMHFHRDLKFLILLTFIILIVRKDVA